MFRQLSAFTAIVAVARAQQACTLTQETHPSLSWAKCSASGACSNVAGSVTIDANWRWTHSTSSATNCYTGNSWNAALCPDNAACAANCCVDGANYQATYGATTSGSALSLKYVTKTPDGGTNVGSRLYLMQDENNYEVFKLLGNEFTFDVDVSQIGCGLNGALYFVSMDQDGGKAKYASNKAGAKYGTGYCDSQCPRDVKFINGQANVAGWGGSDANSGTGNLGSCCAEMDIWEANSISTAFTPHPCSNNDQHSCTGVSCGGTNSPDNRYDGTCDPDGCDFNSYRQGVKDFYGPGLTVDTKQKMTVVTQFIKNADGKLGEIKRFYVQNGRVIPNSQSTIAGVSGNSITEAYCDAQKSVFGDYDQFGKRGDLAGMGDALEKGMVLVMSLWDDGFANMLWLDSTYPVTSTQPGAARGTCPTDGSKPDDLRVKVPNSSVVFSNIKFGPIGSTFNQGDTTTTSVRTSTTTVRTSTSSVRTTTTTTPATSPTPGTGTQQRWQQCGGRDYKGPYGCASPWTCNVINEYYHQCL